MTSRMALPAGIKMELARNSDWRSGGFGAADLTGVLLTEAVFLGVREVGTAVTLATDAVSPS